MFAQARAQEALDFVLENLRRADRGSQGTLLREATLLCSSYPVLFTDKMLAEVRQVDRSDRRSSANGGSRVITSSQATLATNSTAQQTSKTAPLTSATTTTTR